MIQNVREVLEGGRQVKEKVLDEDETMFFSDVVLTRYHSSSVILSLRSNGVLSQVSRTNGFSAPILLFFVDH